MLRWLERWSINASDAKNGERAKECRVAGCSNVWGEKSECEGGKEKRREKGEAGGQPDSEEMAVSSREEHVPDYLSRCKDIILFAPIVPHFAETLKMWAP